jgi:hypothetical protein
MLSKQVKSARAFQAKKRRVEMLCRRLDTLVVAAEKKKQGSKGRAALMARADQAREKLRVADH